MELQTRTIDIERLEAIDHPFAIRAAHEAEDANIGAELGEPTGRNRCAASNLAVESSCETFLSESGQGIKFGENLIDKELANHRDLVGLGVGHFTPTAI
jgi:hypothetical protein